MVIKSYKDSYTESPENGDVFVVRRDEKIHNAGVYSDGLIVQLKSKALL